MRPLLLLLLAAAHPQPAPILPRSQDLGEVKVTCETGNAFIVSLNDDDDDTDGRRDRQAAPPSQTEDNLRQLVFGDRDTRTVKVGSPTGRRVRAWDATRARPFDFSREHVATAAQPLVMYVEGIQPSAGAGDIAMPYTFEHATGTCSATLKGTVIEAKIDKQAGVDSARIERHRKLLVGGRITVQAEKRPANPPVQPAWSFPRGTLATPGAWSSSLEAVAIPAVTVDQDLLTLRMTSARGSRQTIEVVEPLTVTVAASVAVDVPSRLPPFSAAVTFRSGDNVHKHVQLFRWKVPYAIRDQFARPIVESARGGSRVQIREEGPLRHLLRPPPAPFMSLDQWIATVMASRKWRDPSKEGTIDDLVASFGPAGQATLPGLEIGRIVARSEATGLLRLHPYLRSGSHLFHLNPHVWHISVLTRAGFRAADHAVTQNELIVEVTDYRGSDFDGNGVETVTFRSSYAVAMP